MAEYKYRGMIDRGPVDFSFKEERFNPSEWFQENQLCQPW
jgi:hypothetical protein